MHKISVKFEIGSELTSDIPKKPKLDLFTDKDWIFMKLADNYRSDIKSLTIGNLAK